MDPLMNAMFKRLRGRIRFQKDVETEQRRVQLVRERLERAVSALIEGRVQRQARISGDEVRFIATVILRDLPLIAAGKHAYVEVLAAATKAITERLARMIGHGMLTGHFQDIEEFSQVVEVGHGI